MNAGVVVQCGLLDRWISRRFSSAESRCKVSWYRVPSMWASPDMIDMICASDMARICLIENRIGIMRTVCFRVSSMERFSESAFQGSTLVSHAVMRLILQPNNYTDPLSAS